MRLDPSHPPPLSRLFVVAGGVLVVIGVGVLLAGAGRAVFLAGLALLVGGLLASLITAVLARRR
jgi:hypothetical protein